jgi:hypothetical protein
MSLEAIGEQVGRHPSTVGYWLKKHGLEAAGASRHRPKGPIDRRELERLVEDGCSLREIAVALNRGVATVRHWMKRYGLQTRRAEGPVLPRPKKIRRVCGRHGETHFVLEGRGYYRCTGCRAEAVSKYRRSVKRKLVEEAGGRCAVCGYSRCQQALQFHHLDPTAKAFHLGDRGICRSLSKSRIEAKKCVLLCANCHAEVEAGIASLPLNFQLDVDPR